MMNDKIKKLIEKTQLKDTLQQEFNLGLEQRIKRYLSQKPHGIISNSHFATVSTECYLLYRDGHYYGTISLIQSVAEALVKFLCEVNGWKPCKNFEDNVKTLIKREKITPALESLFGNIWQERNNYHHLNLKIEQDRRKLSVLAKEKLSCLKKIEGELFACSTNQGKLVPKYPKYWDQKGGKVPVYLRLD